MDPTSIDPLSESNKGWSPLWIQQTLLPFVDSTILEEEIRRLMTENIESKCMVLGDLNARVGNVPDFISNDEADSFINHANWYTPDYFNNRRHSKDNTLSKFGKSLIDLCCEMNMHILNGRCKGDEVP